MHILGLRALADFIAKSTYFEQADGTSCTIGHAFQLARKADRNTPGVGMMSLKDHITYAANMLGITFEEAFAIWTNHYPNRTDDWGRPTQVIAVEHLRQLADKYEPASPIDAKPTAPPSPQEAPLVPMAIIQRELVPA